MLLPIKNDLGVIQKLIDSDFKDLSNKKLILSIKIFLISFIILFMIEFIVYIISSYYFGILEIGSYK